MRSVVNISSCFSFVGVVGVVGVVVVIGGCGPAGGPDAVADELPEASTFSCSELDGSETACMDFNDGESTGFASEGGRWEVVDGRYVGWGPDEPAGPCSDSLMTHAIWSDVQAQDLSVHVRMASVKRVDKVLALRSVDNANRVQLNFRALADNGGLGDLMIQEVRNCVFTMYTTEQQVPVPHDVGENLDVDVDLIGTHLHVKVGGHDVFNDEVPVAVEPGRIGVGVIDHSESVFDDLIVRSADP